MARRKKERHRFGQFVPIRGGTPIFEIDGHQAAEFDIEKHDQLFALVNGLLEREAWMMLIPPQGDSAAWTLLIELDHVPYVERRLCGWGGLYLTRGPHTAEHEPPNGKPR